ncbi:hypothetical protein [Nonomuraea longicatena]|uniref:PASTA domain-containing protein n=1 Tax=Nonomuraea longicatena TaxID=83682 RepID=A0ABP3ZRM7_9ACTN
MRNDIDSLVARIAPDPGPGHTPLAGELLNEITSAPVAETRSVPRRRRYLRLAAPVLAAAAAVATFAVIQAPAAAALDIERVDGYHVITVKDLMADPSVYESELKARGLDITLTVTPTSANLAGSIFVMTDDLDPLRSGEPVAAKGTITAISAPGPCHRFGGCPTGLKVPLDFEGKAEVILGRQAEAGEKYAMPPGIGMFGEPLYCVDYVNKNVADVNTLLRGRGVEPQFTVSGQQPQSAAPDDWYVHDGVMSAEGKALLLVGPDPNDKPKPVDVSCGN